MGNVGRPRGGSDWEMIVRVVVAKEVMVTVVVMVCVLVVQLIFVVWVRSLLTLMVMAAMVMIM